MRYYSHIFMLDLIYPGEYSGNKIKLKNVLKTEAATKMEKMALTVNMTNDDMAIWLSVLTLTSDYQQTQQ